jgi:hypothetical protein
MEREREAERAEVTDPAQFGQVTPGAVTPAAAGSPERFYEATGVGQSGPRHLSGPPPVADPSGGSWSAEGSDARRWLPAAIVAGAGSIVGLAVAAFWRRRARRQSRFERLRSRARQAAAVASSAAVVAGERAARMSENVDPRATAGGGLALTTAVALYAALRRTQQERMRRAEAQRAASEAAARSRRVTARFGSQWMARSAAWRPKAIPPWAFVAGGLALVALSTVAVQRATRREPDWTGAMTADSGPTGEPPISP